MPLTPAVCHVVEHPNLVFKCAFSLILKAVPVWKLVYFHTAQRLLDGMKNVSQIFGVFFS